MKRSNRLVLLVGIFLAVVAFILIALTLGGGGTPTETPSAPPTTQSVVVAARDIPVGTKLSAGDLGTQTVEIANVKAGAFGDKTQVIGQLVRQSVSQGEPITTSTLTGEAGVINKRLDVPAGKVAMSVRVDQVSGVGTIIKPGDYVDAVIAFNIQPVNIDPETGVSTPLGEAGTSVKTLLQGMQVLGTLLPPPPAPGANATPAPAGDSTSLTDQQEIVILAVTAQQAEVLNYAQIKGAVGPNGITLTLRSIQDFQDAAGQPSTPPDTVTPGVVLSILIRDYGVLVPGFENQVPPSPSPTPRP